MEILTSILSGIFEFITSPLGGFLIILLILFILFLVIKAKVDGFFRSAGFGSTKEITKLVADAYREEQFLPKSIVDMSAVYKPRLLRDIPDTSYEYVEQLVKTSFLDALDAVSKKDITAFEAREGGIKMQVQNEIDELVRNGNTAHYDNVKVHKMGISNYKGDQNEATVDFEISMQSKYYVENEKGKVVNGDKEKLTQSVYRVRAIYLQKGNDENNSMFYSYNCPNCGAPVSGSGDTFKCTYCGSGLDVVETSRIWQVAGYKLIK